MRISESRLRSIIRKKIISEFYNSNYKGGWGGGNEKEEFKKTLIDWYKKFEENLWKQCCENILENIVFSILDLSRKKDGEAPNKLGEYNKTDLYTLRNKIKNSTDINFIELVHPGIKNIDSYEGKNLYLLKSIVNKMKVYFELEDWLDILEEVCDHHECSPLLTQNIETSRSFLESERENL